jgi:hypothetical protein
MNINQRHLLEQLHFLRARREDMRRQLAGFERRFSATERAIAAFECARLGQPDPGPEIEEMEREHRARYSVAASGLRRSLSELNSKIHSILAELISGSRHDRLDADSKPAEERLMRAPHDEWWETQGKPCLESMFGD